MDESKSECHGGWMHRYEIIEQDENGVLEICPICHDMQYFPHNIPSHEYLNYHIRSMLQLNNSRFYYEYR